jgi:hypothetical protein
MVRSILGVILGYLAMFLIVMGGLTVAYLALGADRAFQPGTYEVTTTWLAVWAPVSIVAAIVGGVVCAKVSAHRTPATVVLAGLVLVLGALTAAAQIRAEAPTGDAAVRTGDTPNLEAMTSARSPDWIHIANPLIGAVGVLIGASIAGRGAKPAS